MDAGFVRDPSEITIKKPPRKVVVAVLLVAAVVIVATGLVLNSAKRVSLGGLSFQVPFSWAVHTDMPATTGPGNMLALIGTMPWGPCDSYDVNCHFQERLSRNEIEVDVSIVSRFGSDFCAYARERPDLEPRTDGIRVTETHYFRIDGRPAIVTLFSLDTSDYYGSDGWRQWEIAPADTTSAIYRIFAKWRGPDDAPFLAALDRLVETIDLGPSGYATNPPGDCADPFPAAAT
jgi:hypothetical protein